MFHVKHNYTTACVFLPSFLLFLMFECYAAIANEVDERKYRLDSISRSMEMKMRSLDTTLSHLDFIMDSLTGKNRRKLDTMDLLLQYKFEREKYEKEKRGYAWGAGVLLALLILITYIWNTRKNKL